MTIWYTLLTLLTMIAFSIVIYFMAAYALEEISERNNHLLLQQVTTQIKKEHGDLVIEDEIPVASNAMYRVIEENGNILASYGADIAIFDRFPIEPNHFRHAKGTVEEWLLLDSDVVRVKNFSLRIRVAISCELNNRILATLRLVLLAGIPIILLVEMLGGRLIAARSLKPISQIIHSANRISEGDLSARIPHTPTKDELDELTATLNGMLQAVETAFIREKRFTSDASHELRTPVAIIRACTESMLVNSNISDEQESSLATILSECSRMQKIIGQLLTITRGQENRYPICMEDINLWDICCGVADTMTDKLNERCMSLHFDVPVELTFQGDQSLITEMMLNLVENAEKYGKEQGHINIRAQRNTEYLHIEISDDGIGIAEEALPHIFERFYRADAARDRSGTGLGLSIVDWIVKAHHGTIDVTSIAGQGTLFVVTLPSIQK